jgi:hypothetical protein
MKAIPTQFKQVEPKEWQKKDNKLCSFMVAGYNSSALLNFLFLAKKQCASDPNCLDDIHFIDNLHLKAWMKLGADLACP